MKKTFDVTLRFVVEYDRAGGSAWKADHVRELFVAKAEALGFGQNVFWQLLGETLDVIVIERKDGP